MLLKGSDLLVYLCYDNDFWASVYKTRILILGIVYELLIIDTNFDAYLARNF